MHQTDEAFSTACSRGHFDVKGAFVSLKYWLAVLSFITGYELHQPVLQAQPITKVSPESTAEGQKRKYVNKIPYDVFFDRPLQILASEKSASNEPEKQVEGASGSHSDSTKNENPPDAAVPRIRLEIAELHMEVKTIRNRLASSLANQAKFRQNFISIGVDGSELATLATIAQTHAETVSWKDKSHYVREFSMQIVSAAKEMDKSHFEETKSAFQRLTASLDGSIPPHQGDIPVFRRLHETASRQKLMKRIEVAKDWLGKEIQTEVAFKSMTGEIRHETAVLAALAGVIATNGYDDTDNEDYQRYAKQLVDGANEASSAMAEAAYGRFRQSIDKINKSCTDCHGVYGNR